MRVAGLISDTHGLVREEALRALAGVDLIIHAGDIGTPEVLERLRALAPVHAVRGNNDRGGWARAIPETAALELDGVRIHVLHDLNTLELEPRAARPAVVIAGHSHRPSASARDGVLYVNPGSAGPRRFKLPVTVGFLELRAGSAHARIERLL